MYFSEYLYPHCAYSFLYLKLLYGKNDDLKLPFEKELKSGNFGELHAECLTDTWIGKSRCTSFFLSNNTEYIAYYVNIYINLFCFRWAFIDLTAGPFSWGPAVGGEGVRTELSLPNVQNTIGAVTGTCDNCACIRLVCLYVLPFKIRLRCCNYARLWVDQIETSL